MRGDRREETGVEEDELRIRHKPHCNMRRPRKQRECRDAASFRADVTDRGGGAGVACR